MTEATPKTLTVVIAAEDQAGLDGMASGHFGRCPYYFVAELDQDGRLLRHRSVPNPTLANHQVGAAPLFIQSLGADVIISGGMGPRAIQLFQQYGVSVATGAQGRIRDVLADFVAGRLRGATPCAEHGEGHHHGSELY